MNAFSNKNMPLKVVSFSLTIVGCRLLKAFCYENMSLKVVESSNLTINGCRLLNVFSYKNMSLKVVSSSLTIGGCRLAKLL